MELTLDYPKAKFEADNNLADPNVISKYKIAADIANGMFALPRFHSYRSNFRETDNRLLPLV